MVREETEGERGVVSRKGEEEKTERGRENQGGWTKKKGGMLVHAWKAAHRPTPSALSTHKYVANRP